MLFGLTAFTRENQADVEAHVTRYIEVYMSPDQSSVFLDNFPPPFIDWRITGGDEPPRGMNIYVAGDDQVWMDVRPPVAECSFQIGISGGSNYSETWFITVHLTEK